MNKSIVSIFIAFIFAMALIGGCIPAATSTPVLPTPTSSPMPATLTREPKSTATLVTSAVPPPKMHQTETAAETVIPAKNGWQFDYTPTIPITAVNHATQQEIASLLFTEWLTHFKTEDADSRSRLIDFRLVKVDIPRDPSSIIDMAQPAAISVEFVAATLFSVKPSVFMYSDWQAAMGDSTDNIWINDKYQVIGIKKKNDLYIMVLLELG